MELIPDWKTSYQFSSMWATAALAAFDALALGLPAMHDYITPVVFASINLVCAVLIAVCRVVQQTSVPVPAEVKAALVDAAVATPVAPPEPVKE